MDTTPLPDLRITLVQPDLLWEQPERNLAHLQTLIASIGQTTDVVILPEMFTTGFTMNAQPLAEKMDGKSVKWLQTQASQLNALVMGSLIIEIAGKYYNRMVAAHPDGRLDTYDKRHLFRLAHEDEHFTAGAQKTLLYYKGWRILPQICYDLRFPVYSRNQQLTSDSGYDLLVYVANWPEVRSNHWRRLLPARAIENQCYVAAVNRVGIDGKQHAYRGDSAVYDFQGDAPVRLATTEAVSTTPLNGRALQAYREKFMFWQDADSFTIH